MSCYFRFWVILVGLGVLSYGLGITLQADDVTLRDPDDQESPEDAQLSPEQRRAKKEFQTSLKELCGSDSKDLELPQDARALLAIGHADERTMPSLEKATSQQLETRLSLVKAGRLAAQRSVVQNLQQMVLQGSLQREELLTERENLARLQFEQTNTPAERLAVLKNLVAATGFDEDSVRSRRKDGFDGGQDSVFFPSLAKRLHWEERLVQEIASQRKLPAIRPGGLVAGTDQEQLQRDTKTLEAIAAPDKLIAESLARATPRDIEAKLTTLKQGRLAALRKTIAAFVHYRNGGDPRISNADFLNAYAELVHAEIEYAKTPQARVAALKANLTRTANFERDNRVSYERGGADGIQLWQAIAARIKAEEMLAQEILAQRKLKPG